jgi:hypothetical protein
MKFLRSTRRIVIGWPRLLAYTTRTVELVTEAPVIMSVVELFVQLSFAKRPVAFGRR